MSTAREAAIRELYAGAARGRLRVELGEDLWPWLAKGDVVQLERGTSEQLSRGDLMGVKEEGGRVRLLRYLGREPGAALGLAGSSLMRVRPELVVGRAVGVERPAEGSRELSTQPRGPGERGRLWAEELKARARARRGRWALKGYLTRLYWDVNQAFASGEAATGDILVTDRCPVGCRFCLYSCVPEGSDMSTEAITEAARQLRQIGVSKVRILGGEPFISLEMALRSFRAVAAVYEPDAIHVLSSGHWGGTDQLVVSRLDPVAAAGLKHLMLSFDSFHIERFPIDNYERILKRSTALGLEVQLNVHYSAGLMPHLPRLIELKRRYPFSLRLLTVSKEGRAELLNDAELSVAGVFDFRRQLLSEPGVEITSEDGTCFRWTIFPSGEVNFCCKQDPKNVVGRFGEQSLPELRTRLEGLANKNRLRVLQFAASYDGELSWNPCLSCPLKAQ